MPAYMVNGEHFKTQKDLKERIHRILYAYSFNDTLNEVDTRFLYALVEGYHPSAEIKIGMGVKRIEVRQNRIYRQNREFWIVRTDDTETDFSFMECLRASKPLDKFRTACRAAISGDMATAKYHFWLGRTSAACPLTGAVMSFDDSHVHHTGVNDFAAIVDAFIRQEALDVAAVQLVGAVDGVIGDRFQDHELERRFIIFHSRMAELQVVSKFGNLSTARTKSGQVETETGQQLRLF